MAEQAVQLITVDQFLLWSDNSDVRHELADGIIRAMAPPTGPHSALTANVVVALHRALETRLPCRPLVEAAIRIDEHTMWQADVAVTCKPILREIHGPVLVVEILSPSTRTHDLGRKLFDYKNLPTVSEIWMINSERHWMQYWRREQDGWLGQDFVGSASFDSSVLQVRLTLDDLYADSGL